MLIADKFTLNADIQQVWDSMLDPGTLFSCVPGAEKIEKVDDKTYDAVVKQKVGPIAAKFKFTTTLVEMDPPRHLRAVGKGADVTKLGTFTHEMVIDLLQLSGNQVEVSYNSNVNVVGRLATFGERIMRAKAAEVGAQLTRNLQARLASK
ncbi:MAG: hypothetical protein HY673_26205 [Chloroflexi bacterium]|nr:hypothetical protein [Chloroflexota bacterium]